VFDDSLEVFDDIESLATAIEATANIVTTKVTRIFFIRSIS
jgi:hypothetical protein